MTDTTDTTPVIYVFSTSRDTVYFAHGDTAEQAEEHLKHRIDFKEQHGWGMYYEGKLSEFIENMEQHGIAQLN